MNRDVDPAEAVTLALQRALWEAAGGPERLLALVTFQVDLGEPVESVVARAEVDRATRSLIFVSGQAQGADGRTAGSGSAVYRVRAPEAGAAGA